MAVFMAMKCQGRRTMASGKEVGESRATTFDLWGGGIANTLHDTSGISGISVLGLAHRTRRSSKFNASCQNEEPSKAARNGLKRQRQLLRKERLADGNPFLHLTAHANG